jgi:5-methylthioribose kinase
MFYPLTADNAVEYIKTTPLHSGYFHNADDLKAVDLAVGNINLIFRVYSEKEPKAKSVLIKQALPYARKYPDFKMPQKRALLENEALQREHRYCPGLVPQVYYFDEQMFANIMEDLNKHIIMRYGLMKQVRYEKFAEHMGLFLARTLFYTSDLNLASAEKKALVGKFINPVMCKVTEDLVFTQPFIEHENNHWTPQLTPQIEGIQGDDSIRAEIFLLKQSFMTEAQALIHGDLHTGSIMVNEEETKIIDPEFCFFGPMGFDIGAVLGNLVLSYASQSYHGKSEGQRKDYQHWLLETVSGVWTRFEQEFRKLMAEQLNDQWPSNGFREKYLTRLLQDTAGFGAAKIMRRVIGLAHVPDMWEIPEDSARAIAESLALEVARSWLMNRGSISSIQDLVEMILEAKPHPKVSP